jgi:hypothetical protein
VTAVLARPAGNTKPHLSWAPLAAAIAGIEVAREPLGTSVQGIARFLDVDDRQLRRWIRNGISPDTADRVCFAIGRHPLEFWPHEWGTWGDEQ